MGPKSFKPHLPACSNTSLSGFAASCALPRSSISACSAVAIFRVGDSHILLPLHSPWRQPTPKHWNSFNNDAAKLWKTELHKVARISPPPRPLVALQSNAGHGPVILEVPGITHKDATRSVGLLWAGDQLVAETSTSQQTTVTRDKHPYPPKGFEPAILASERPQTHASDHAVTGISSCTYKWNVPTSPTADPANHVKIFLYEDGGSSLLNQLCQ